LELLVGIPEGCILWLGAEEKLGKEDGVILGTKLGASLLDGLKLLVGIVEGCILWLGTEEEDGVAEGSLLGE
jgi:hypothetical protein